MTARTRSRLRFGAMFTASTLVVMALCLLMVRGAYDSAYADGAAQVANTPPALHSPPTLDDAWSLAQTGQWAAFAAIALAGVLLALTKLGDRFGVAWLAKRKRYFAAVATVLLGSCAALVTDSGPRAIGVVLGAVLLALWRADSPPAETATPPRNPEAGYVAPHINLVLSIGLALLLAVPFAASCSSPAARGLGGSLRQEIVDCGRAEVQDLAADLVPAVTAIVTGDTPSWREQLDALLHAGTHAGACAIRAVGGELAARAAAVVTGAHAEGQERLGAEHAREYLAARGFVFEVRQ